MVTKEQCLVNKVIECLEYGHNEKVAQTALALYNQGKKYSSEMIFMNDERGLDQALQGFSPSFIVYSVIGDNSDYNPNDPFFTISNGIKSLDGFDIGRMLRPEDKQKLSNVEVFEELEDYQIEEAFDDFARTNYPQIYENIDTDSLYEIGYRTGYAVLNADWTKIVQELQQYNPDAGINESKIVKLTENDLQEMTNKILKQLKKK